jgi:CRP-like cAMP-binding protein
MPDMKEAGGALDLSIGCSGKDGSWGAGRTGLDALTQESRTFPARQLICGAHQVGSDAALVVDGMLGSHIDDRRGVRQVTAIHIPGDFINLAAHEPGRGIQNIAALTDCIIEVIPQHRLGSALETLPELAHTLWQAAAAASAIQQMWLFRIGRLSAVERIAHLLCELNERLKAVALSDGYRFSLNLTQADLAEIVGITQVHANRVLRQLRQEHLCSFRRSVVEIPDPEALARRGQFNQAYLRPFGSEATPF